MKSAFLVALFGLAACTPLAAVIITPNLANPYTYTTATNYDPLPNHGFGTLKLSDFGNKLTDGAYGDMIPGDRLADADPSNWVEFSGIAEMTFHFTGTPTIEHITLSMANWTPAAIYLPNAVSVNGGPVTYAGTYPDKSPAFIDLYGSWTGDDLVLRFEYPSYMFADEVTFAGTAAIPEPGTYGLLAGLAALGVVTGFKRIKRPKRRR